MPLDPVDNAKRAAAVRALEYVEDGMTLGLGTGSTAGWFVRLLSERIRETGLSVTGVATSSATVWLAEELGRAAAEAGRGGERSTSRWTAPTRSTTGST